MHVTGLRLPSLEGLDDYLVHLPAVRYLNELRLTQPVTFLVGDNGSGKSTLLEAIALACGFDASGGPLGGWNGTIRHTGTESNLYRHLKVRRSGPLLRGFFLRAETHFTMLTGADVVAGQPPQLLARSHGESIMDILGHHVDGAGLYLLDEPEAGLSPVRQMVLLAEIHQAVDRGAQFMIATHSPILPAVPRASIIDVGEAGLRHISYEQVEAVSATREFLTDPRGTVDYLIAD